MISTSAEDWDGHKTGLWLEELATPYYIFKEKGYQVLIASPLGGAIPIDPASLAGDACTAACTTFMNDDTANGTMSKLQHSIPLQDIDILKEHVDAIYLAGGHGTCVDFINNPILTKLIETTYGAGKIVAAVCHGPNGLCGTTLADGTTPLVQGKAVTGFSETEETTLGLHEKVPFLLETKLKELGGKYENAATDWGAHVCVDGNLMTGQNPASSEPLAHAMTKVLG